MTRDLAPPSLLCECGHPVKDHPRRAICHLCRCIGYVERDPFACLCGHVHRPGMACDRDECWCQRSHTSAWTDYKW